MLNLIHSAGSGNVNFRVKYNYRKSIYFNLVPTFQYEFSVLPRKVAFSPQKSNIEHKQKGITRIV